MSVVIEGLCLKSEFWKAFNEWLVLLSFLYLTSLCRYLDEFLYQFLNSILFARNYIYHYFERWIFEPTLATIFLQICSLIEATSENLLSTSVILFIIHPTFIRNHCANATAKLILFNLFKYLSVVLFQTVNFLLTIISTITINQSIWHDFCYYCSLVLSFWPNWTYFSIWK